MADTMKDQSSVISGNKSGGSGKLVRYPLRSGSKSKDEKPVPSSASASASRRLRPSSSVSQSVSALNLSSKEKTAKPLRRLSIPTKPTAGPTPQSAKTITPISEARANRSRNIEGRSETPVSDASRTLSRRKFSVLSSASYWLSHIKLSEAAGKHQLSLGFFKLAQEAACENPQLLRDELKSYALRHNIIDLGKSAQELLQSYEISEDIVQGARSSSEGAQSVSSVNEVHKPKPKSMPKSSSTNISRVAKESVKENKQKKLVSSTKASTNKKITDQQSVSEAGSRKIQKNFQNPIKKEFNKAKQLVKNKGKKSADEDTLSGPEEVVTEENKENMEATVVEEISLET